MNKLKEKQEEKTREITSAPTNQAYYKLMLQELMNIASVDMQHSGKLSSSKCNK
jgi:hypothetical protein